MCLIGDAEIRTPLKQYFLHLVNMNNKEEYIVYKEIFEEQMREGVDIFNINGELLETTEDEEFRQCYSLDDKRKSMLPLSP